MYIYIYMYIYLSSRFALIDDIYLYPFISAVSDGSANSRQHPRKFSHYIVMSLLNFIDCTNIAYSGSFTYPIKP